MTVFFAYQYLPCSTEQAGAEITGVAKMSYNMENGEIRQKPYTISVFGDTLFSTAE